MLVAMAKRPLTAGFKAALHNTLDEWRIFRLHRQGVRKARAITARELKLHIGAGPKKKPGWVNIDLDPDFAPDLTLDLREKLPFADGSCAIIYSEHFLEHIDYPEPAASFLKECLRVLMPGGRFSVGVPDTEWPLMEYCGVSNGGYFNIAKERFHPDWCRTRMEHINYHFRQGREHRFAYDFETLSASLAQSGFEGIVRRAFDTGLDSAEREVGTLYVDALKPRVAITGSGL